MIGLSKAQKSDDSQEDELNVVGDKESEDVGEEESEFDLYFGILVAFTGAWTFAVCSVLNRKLKEIGYEALMVYHGLIGGGAASLFILVEGAFRGGFRFYTGEQYLILLVASTFDCVACNSMTIAYQRDSSGFVSLLGYAIILYGFLADLIFFNEEIQTLQLLGALIIFAATFIVAVYKLCEAFKERKLAQLKEGMAKVGI